MKHERYAWLDFARLLSAIGVVIFHYCSNGVASGSVGRGVQRFGSVSTIADYGYLGVNFFFIISGFVIFNSSLGNQPARFVQSRLVRLVPAFVFCMTATTLVVLATHYKTISLTEYVANLTLVPQLVGVREIDAVYWTLTPEILFYAMIWLAMMVGLSRYPRLIVAGGLIVTLISLLSKIYIPYFTTYAPLFPTGCAIALFYRSPSDKTALGMALLGGVVCIWAGYADALHRVTMFPDLKPLVVAFLLGAILASFFVFRTYGSHGASLSRPIGALTYPLYLIHSEIGFAFLSRYQTDANKWLLTALAIVAALCAARFVAVNIEARHAALWKRLAALLVNAPLGTQRRARQTWRDAVGGSRSA